MRLRRLVQGAKYRQPDDLKSGVRGGLRDCSGIEQEKEKTTGKGCDAWQNKKMNQGISILYPNYDLKTGQLAKNLGRWVDSARIAPANFQLVVGTKKLPPSESREVHGVLREQDIFFEVDSADNDNAIWNQCAERSKFENMLFVEGHVYPDESFLMQLQGFVQKNSGQQVINTSARNTNNSAFEKLIDRWFHETIQKRTTCHNFVFLSRWAFLIQKKVFQRYGPLIPEYEQFAPPFLSAILAKNQVSIATADSPGLTHEMERFIGHHHAATRSYIRGFAIAEKQIHAEGLSELFGKNSDFERIRARWDKDGGGRIISRNLPRLSELLAVIGLSKLQIHILEFLIMYVPMPNKMKRRLFKLAHQRVCIDEYKKSLITIHHEK
jgi:hypothetical protein